MCGTALPVRARRGPPRLRPISAALVLRANITCAPLERPAPSATGVLSGLFVHANIICAPLERPGARSPEDAARGIRRERAMLTACRSATRTRRAPGRGIRWRGSWRSRRIASGIRTRCRGGWLAWPVEKVVAAVLEFRDRVGEAVPWLFKAEALSLAGQDGTLASLADAKLLLDIQAVINQRAAAAT